MVYSLLNATNERLETPMVYTLGEAAKATGKSKATISKAIKTGKISAHKLENGQYEIDPAELHRVYQPIKETVSSERLETPENTLVNHEYFIKLRELEIRLQAESEKVIDKEKQLDDLRQDRDKWRQQATALLENRVEAKGFWARLIGR